MSLSGVLVLQRKDDRDGNPKSFTVLRVQNGSVDTALAGLEEGFYNVLNNGLVEEYNVAMVRRNTKVS